MSGASGAIYGIRMMEALGAVDDVEIHLIMSPAYIGMDLSDPDPDFAGLARSFGWYAEGPIDHAKDVGPALKRAIARVKAGQPALLDTITERR